MKTLHLNINNPIDTKSVEQLEWHLLAADVREYDFLVIDTGKHDFDSIGTMRELRQMMELQTERLKAFKKIALIHPPQYDNSSEHPELLQYFNSLEEANDWFSE